MHPNLLAKLGSPGGCLHLCFVAPRKDVRELEKISCRSVAPEAKEGVRVRVGISFLVSMCGHPSKVKAPRRIEMKYA